VNALTRRLVTIRSPGWGITAGWISLWAPPVNAPLPEMRENARLRGLTSG
jgi:hypothetical protein